MSEMNVLNQEVIFNDGDAFFVDLLDSVSEAEKSISIETYIFDLDEFGLRFLEALTEASKRGVLVKLLLDGAGCASWDYQRAKKYRSDRFEIQFFHPMFWQKRHSRIWTYFNPTRTIRGWALMNHRNHRKVYLIDEKIAYVGSFNVSANHLKSLKGEKAWRDTGIKIADDRTKVLKESFFEAWNHHYNYRLRNLNTKLQKAMPLLQLNRSIKERRKSYHALLQRLASAKTKIHITNPYFIPSLWLRHVLVAQVKKGVDVVLLFPSKSDFFAVKLAMEGFYSHLLKEGVSIYEYQPSMIHAKILVTDDRVLLGSSNLNSRSLILDLEVDVEVTSSSNVRLIEEQFADDLSRSKKIELSEWKKRSWLNKLLERFFSLFRWVL